MDWPRLHHLAAIEREKSAPTSKSANKGVDFVCPAKEWEDLQVCQRPTERGLTLTSRKGTVLPFMP